MMSIHELLIEPYWAWFVSEYEKLDGDLAINIGHRSEWSNASRQGEMTLGLQASQVLGDLATVKDPLASEILVAVFMAAPENIDEAHDFLMFGLFDGFMRRANKDEQEKLVSELSKDEKIKSTLTKFKYV